MNEGQIGRLAMRHEGDSWNAYYALPDTMEGALFLGGVRMAIVASKERKDAFLAFMREAVGDIIQEKTGVRPIWPKPPEAAPEHERSGHA